MFHLHVVLGLILSLSTICSLDKQFDSSVFGYYRRRWMSQNLSAYKSTAFLREPSVVHVLADIYFVGYDSFKLSFQYDTFKHANCFLSNLPTDSLVTY